MTKSKVAFLMTCQRIFEAKRDEVYFWTITFATLHSDWECSRRFGLFIQHLRKVTNSGWGGVRVAELHREHGVHYHLLVTQRIPADLVRRVGRCYGIGRVHAQRARPDSALYLAKYLSKRGHGGPKTQSGRSARLWAKFGDVPHTKKSDLVNESPMWVYRRSRGMRFLGYHYEGLLQRAWDVGEHAFHAAYVALRESPPRIGDAIRLGTGALEVVITGRMRKLELVERKPLGQIPF